jgi:hypothetical protein
MSGPIIIRGRIGIDYYCVSLAGEGGVPVFFFIPLCITALVELVVFYAAILSVYTQGFIPSFIALFHCHGVEMLSILVFGYPMDPWVTEYKTNLVL